MNIEQFRKVKAQATMVLGLRRQAESVLARRPLRSFDGFGHFLDSVLGENREQTNALATTVRLPVTTIDQLRASELDPFAGSLEEIAYLGYLLGIGWAEFVRLASTDHSRFARHSQTVFSRSGEDAAPEAVERIQQLWARFEEDQATAL
jgi:hypothetical protein